MGGSWPQLFSEPDGDGVYTIGESESDNVPIE